MIFMLYKTQRVENRLSDSTGGRANSTSDFFICCPKLCCIIATIITGLCKGVTPLRQHYELARSKDKASSESRQSNFIGWIVLGNFNLHGNWRLHILVTSKCSCSSLQWSTQYTIIRWAMTVSDVYTSVLIATQINWHEFWAQKQTQK